MEKKKKLFTLHVDLGDFQPASAEEKEYMVQMRPSTTFFKDGMKRLLKNKIATISMIMIILIALSAVILPALWPYSYDQMLGVRPGKPVDATYNNLAPFEYGTTESIALLGNPKATEYFVPSYVQTTIEDPAEKEAAIAKHAATRENLEQLLEAYVAAGATAEAFAAMEASLPAGYEMKERESVTVKTYKDDPAITQWLLETNWKGQGVRLEGDAQIFDSEFGYYVVRLNGYNAEETTSVFPHVFGTDSQGRDYFIRVVYGARVSLAVGFFASLIVLLIGMTVGSIAGYIGGKVDLVIMRIVDIIYSLPDMLMVILLASVMKVALGDAIEGTILEKLGANMISLFVIFALLYWVSMSRQIRGQILSLKEQEYVLAAKSTGAKPGWIIRKHLLPNCISVVVISTALQIPSAIFTESYLSFLGLGVNAPMPSLGSLASDALNGITSYPYRLVIPAIAISLIVLSLNLFGDGLRDAFDPKLKH